MTPLLSLSAPFPSRSRPPLPPAPQRPVPLTLPPPPPPAPQLAWLPANVSVPADVDALADLAVQRLGVVHLWVNNAGQVGPWPPCQQC